MSRIKLLLLERISLAGIARVMGVSKSWLHNYVNQHYAVVESQATIIPKAVGKCTVQMDELWSFVAYRAVLPSKRHESVGKDSGRTSYIERLNNTFRQRIARLVRKTLSFSRKLENHRAAIWNFIHDYNYQIQVEMLKRRSLEFSPSFT